MTKLYIIKLKENTRLVIEIIFSFDARNIGGFKGNLKHNIRPKSLRIATSDS